jgi:hypothetical protein
MTSTKHFWMTRASQALQDAFAAPSERTRAAYIELVHHYCSMHELVHGSRDKGIGGASQASTAMPAGAAVQDGNPDFQSVHDALMRAA